MKIVCSQKFFIEIDILFFAAMPLIIGAGFVDKYLVTFGVALIHEMTHIGTAVFLGGRIKSLRILAVGLNAEIEEKTFGKYDRLLIYFSGPLINFIIAACSFVINTYYLCESDNMHFFALINLYMGIINILPVMPLDGGKILREILWDSVGIYSTRSYSIRVSTCLAIVITSIGAVQIYNTSNNFSLLIIGLYVFLALISRDGEVALMNIRNVVYRHSRLTKKGIYPARDLVVMKWIQLNELIKSMDFDRFHIIHVLDEDLHLICTFTEQEILDGLVKYEPGITFEDFIKLQK